MTEGKGLHRAQILRDRNDLELCHELATPEIPNKPQKSITRTSYLRPGT